MNKRQLTVAWGMGVGICAVWYLWWVDPLVTTLRCVWVSHVFIFVIGGLLIVTFGVKRG
jgi:hypothetical protein